MINWLDVRDFVLVKHISLSFDDGMTVLTGETGAGKSIIVDALAILLGNRTSGDIIRSGADHAEIQAGFALNNNPQAVAWLASHALTDKSGDCSLRRLVFKTQSSRGFINGHPVPIYYLQELGNFLIDIHSQHEHHQLLRRDDQRIILDVYANTSGLVGTITTSFDQLKKAYHELEQLETRLRDTSEKKALLGLQIEELAMLNPDPDEFAILEEKHKRLSHALELAEETWNVIQALDELEDASASSLINKSTQRLRQLSKHDSRLNQACDQLEYIFTELTEVVSELRSWQSEYDLNPKEVIEAEKRISLLHEASRKYRVQPSELRVLLSDLKDDLKAVNTENIQLESLREQINALEKEYDKAAEKVCEARTSSSRDLAEEVTNNLVELGLPEATFHIELRSIEENRGRYGTESPLFLIRSNPDSQAGPLARIASGGELSRISLAIQVAVTAHDTATSSIYDEVDVGIGGRIAEIVGGKLKALANKRQVLCITHLPQVAVQGTKHMKISKESGKETQIDIKKLDADQRLEEISRMLGGIEITHETRAYAADMLKRAGN